MPSYDYHCPENGQTLEVKHRMLDTLKTWGALCTQAKIEPGNTLLDSLVHKKITGAQFVSTGSEPSNSGGCGTHCGCH